MPALSYLQHSEHSGIAAYVLHSMLLPPPPALSLIHILIQQKKLASIGNPSDFTIDVRRVNQNAPQFMQGYPRVAPGDSLTRVDYMLDREADVYYVVAPVNRLEPDLDDPGLIIDIGQFKDDGDAEAALPEPGKRKEQGLSLIHI